MEHHTTKPGEEDVVLEAEGHRRYAVARFKVNGQHIVLRERIGLHVFDLPEDKREVGFQQSADKLRRRVLSRIRAGR